jgi:alanine racemase
MVMVKAFAYGSGSNEIAALLQYHHIDYLGVAYADEGVELRANHIKLPIMVMNPTEESFPVLLERNLEPEIYSLNLLRRLIKFLNGRSCSIHLKIDTGMHRLGFEIYDLNEVVSLLTNNRNIKIASIFSHLAGTDEAVHDEFSKAQAAKYEAAVNTIEEKIGGQAVRHLLNSSGILRLSEYQYDMVRLGIGLYGIDPSEAFNDKLRTVATLKTVISQIKEVKQGDSIGYSRAGKADKATRIATIAIGYADGYSRRFGNGVGQVLVHGRLAPVIGNVCMDMTMVDITGIPEVKEGDEVIIFGEGLPIKELATMAGTIAYELLTHTSERVKRIVYAVSI